MPSIKLEDALLEVDEDNEIAKQVDDLIAFGTDDPEKIAALCKMIAQSPVWDDDDDFDPFSDFPPFEDEE